jgi:hypothetical protein
MPSAAAKKPSGNGTDVAHEDARGGKLNNRKASALAATDEESKARQSPAAHAATPQLQTTNAIRRQAV